MMVFDWKKVDRYFGNHPEDFLVRQGSALRSSLYCL